jgi:ABC-type glycerol-3-phosphate transport system permease component
MKKNWSDFWFAALIRALRTLAQTAIATIGTSALIEQVDWRIVASASVLAAILSILTSIATGLPEVNDKGAHEK